MAEPLLPASEDRGPDRAPAIELPQRPPLMQPAELIAIGTIDVVDQLSKFLVRASLPLYSKKVIIPRLLDFTHVQNAAITIGAVLVLFEMIGFGRRHASHPV